MIRRLLISSPVIAMLLCGAGCSRGCNGNNESRATPSPAPPPAAPNPTLQPVESSDSAIGPDASTVIDAAAIGHALPLAMPVPLGHDIYRLADGRCQHVPPGGEPRVVPCPPP